MPSLNPIRFFSGVINQLSNLTGISLKPNEATSPTKPVAAGALQGIEQRQQIKNDYDQSVAQVVNERSSSLSPEPWYMNTIPGLKDNANVTPEFLTEVNAMAERLDTRPEYLLSAMSFETGGSFNPGVKNGLGSGATGLIQFMPKTAPELGTTTDELAKMTATEQLPYVEKYMQQHRKAGKESRPLNSLDSVYETILAGHPSGVSDPNQVLYKEGSKEYKQNPFDFNKDGKITFGEVSSRSHCQLFGGVQRVQNRLKELGYLSEADGRLGPDTFKAVEEFQKDNALSVTGYFNEETGHALFGTSSPNAPSLNYTPAGIGRGAQGSEVEIMQNKLVELGFMTQEQQVSGPGIFGPKTEEALKNFQKSQNLPAHGILDDATKAALDAPQSYNAAATQATTSQSNTASSSKLATQENTHATKKVTPLNYTPVGMGRGAQGSEVMAMQDKLVEFGFMTQAQQLSGPGIFGPQTESALKRFQRSQNLPPHGILDDATQAALDAPQSKPRLASDLIPVDHAIPELTGSGKLRQKISSPVFGDITVTESFMNLGAPHGVKKNPRYAIFSSDPEKVVKQEGGGQANIGIDYTSSNGRIRSWFSGTVEKVEFQPRGYGNIITIKTDQTFTYQGKEYPLYTHYAHADNFTVKEGRVEAGQDIGKQGNTGGSHGAHVDFRTWIVVDGQKIDISPNFFVDVP